MKNPLRSIRVFCGFTVLCTVGYAGPASVSLKAIEAAVEAAERMSGKSFAGVAAKQAAVKEVERLAGAHGAGVLKIVEDSGIELLKASPRYGDDLVRIAEKATPQARRALALNADELMPLAKRIGVEAVELEAKAPGQAMNIIRVFGDDTAKVFGRSIPAQDIPRLLKYGEKADSPATRELLLERYAKEGADLFRRIPPQLVLAGGLSASMLLVAHDSGAESRAKGEVLRNNPDIARDVMKFDSLVGAGTIVALGVVAAAAWLFKRRRH